MIGGDVVDSNAEVELSFERDADLLMEEEAAVDGEFVKCRREVGVVNPAGGVDEPAVR